MKKCDFLWDLYLSERNFVVHHENQRTNASNILAAIAAGLLVALGTGAITYQIQIAISMLLVMIGVFGYLFSIKLYCLIQLHAKRSYQCLEALDKEIAAGEIAKIKAIAKEDNESRFGRLHRIGLNRIWASFHLAITTIGIVLLFLNYFWAL